MNVSPILKYWVGGGKYGYTFRCPGCKSWHTINTNPGGWGFNGNVDKPTFTPSVLVTYNGPDADKPDGMPARCHSFVTDGQIQFLADSTHELAGKTVDLPEWKK